MKLNRFIFAICLAAAFTAAPSAVQAFDANVAGIEEAVGEAKITVNNNSDNQEVRVQDAESQRLEVYNVLGVRVASYRVDTTRLLRSDCNAGATFSRSEKLYARHLSAKAACLQ